VRRYFLPVRIKSSPNRRWDKPFRRFVPALRSSLRPSQTASKWWWIASNYRNIASDWRRLATMGRRDSVLRWLKPTAKAVCL